MSQAGAFFTILLSCLFWHCPVSTQSQTRKLYNTPITSDELYKYAMNPWIDSQVVDLRKCKLDAARKTEKYIELSDNKHGILCLVDNGTLSYYSIGQDTLYSLGFENHKMDIKYIRKVPILTYPLISSSVQKSPVIGKGYCGEIPVKCLGQSESHVESGQKLISPQGKVYNHPLSVSREEDLTFVFGSHGQITRKICRRFRDIYVPGFQYPIVKEYGYREEGGDSLIQCFYYPIEEQTMVHQVVRNEMADAQISDDGTKSFHNHLINYQFTNDENNKTVRIRYSSVSDCKLSFVLSSVSGIVYRSVYKNCKAGEQNSIELSYEDLRTGQYAVGIIAGEEQRSESFYVK